MSLLGYLKERYHIWRGENKQEEAPLQTYQDLLVELRTETLMREIDALEKKEVPLRDHYRNLREGMTVNPVDTLSERLNVKQRTLYPSQSAFARTLTTRERIHIMLEQGEKPGTYRIRYATGGTK